MTTSNVYQGISIPGDKASAEQIYHFVETAHSVDIAAFVENLQPESGIVYLLALEAKKRAKVFRYI